MFFGVTDSNTHVEVIKLFQNLKIDIIYLMDLLPLTHFSFF